MIDPINDREAERVEREWDAFYATSDDHAVGRIPLADFEPAMRRHDEEHLAQFEAEWRNRFMPTDI